MNSAEVLEYFHFLLLTLNFDFTTDTDIVLLLPYIVIYSH